MNYQYTLRALYYLWLKRTNIIFLEKGMGNFLKRGII